MEERTESGNAYNVYRLQEGTHRIDTLVMYETVKRLEIPRKTVNLIKTTADESTNSVTIEGRIDR